MKLDQPITAVLFDFDGVLADTAPDIISAMIFALQQAGLPQIPADQLAAFVGGGTDPIVMRSLQALGVSEHFDRVWPLFLQRYHERFCEETQLYPGVRNILQALHARGYRLAIVTNKPEQLAWKILDPFEASAYFEIIIGPGLAARPKPHPEPILLALQRLDIPAPQALMVGDSPGDIQAGKAAGVRTCAVAYGYGRAADLAALVPDYTIDNPGQLITILEKE